MNSSESPHHLTAGIPGAELIRRRAKGLCTACGVTPVFALNASSDQPWLCARCRGRLPKKRRFDTKQHREEGIRNLDRLERER